DPHTRELLADAPVLDEFIGAESKQEFAQLLTLLEQAGIACTRNPALVRGLDYYNGVVFEWTTDKLGAQSTVCAGGRYDNLSAQLGGTRTPAVGFAMGLERLLLLLEETGAFPQELARTLDVYLVVAGQGVQGQALQLGRELRRRYPRLRILTHCGGGKYNAQLKKAYASGARCALILEGDAPQAAIKARLLEAEGASEELPLAELDAWLRRQLAERTMADEPSADGTRE
ncbi:MAG TPA: ATP phosphoribosyltransferase regulatory subunit, partial [Hyphomicrobiales bacterium]|nr:ATP phosphoribosyltransferase regulatory subunit [Hyphomicrobiales bacterium]